MAQRRFVRTLLEWGLVLVIGLMLALLIRVFVFETFTIPSESMRPTLQVGDKVLVEKMSYRFSDIGRGDVVVFSRPPGLQDTSIAVLIKRVVAIPGDTVESKGGVLYVNGEPQSEPYLHLHDVNCAGTEGVTKTTVPAEGLFVMGDNRCNSSDSRVFGMLDSDLVIGRAVFVIWPFSHTSSL